MVERSMDNLVLLRQAVQRRVTTTTSVTFCEIVRYIRYGCSIPDEGNWVEPSEVIPFLNDMIRGEVIELCENPHSEDIDVAFRLKGGGL